MQTSLQTLSEFLVLFPIIPFFFIPTSHWIISDKKKFFINILVVFVCFFLFSFFAIYLFQIPDTNYLIVVVFGYFLWFYIQEISLNKYAKIFWFFTSCLLGCFSELFAVTIDAYMHPHLTYDTFSYIRIISQFIFIIITEVILYYPVKKYYTWVFDNFHSEKTWKFLCLFTVILITVSLFLIPHHFDFVLRHRYFKMYVSILVLFFSLIIIIYILLYRIIYSFVKNQKIIHENQLLSIQANQYNQLLSYVNKTRKLRHDFKHQIVVITELLNQKKYDELNEYIHSINSLSSYEMTQYSYSTAINAILSHYASLCKERNIKAYFKISLPNEIPVSEMDLGVLLGNLLENALDACQNVEQPYITLKLALTSPSILALKMSNTYQGKIIQKNNHFISTKHKDQGLGIESVKIISKKYNGMSEFYFDDKVFNVKVLLKF